MQYAMHIIKWLCITILSREVVYHGISIKVWKKTENKTIRFPVPLINEIEKVLEGTEITFSRFVIQACEYALQDLSTTEKINKQEKETTIKN